MIRHDDEERRVFPATVISRVQIGDDGRSFVVRAWYRATEAETGWAWAAETEDRTAVVIGLQRSGSAEQARENAITTLTRICS